jgi:hypothetical protein
MVWFYSNAFRKIYDCVMKKIKSLKSSKILSFLLVFILYQWRRLIYFYHVLFAPVNIYGIYCQNKIGAPHKLNFLAMQPRTSANFLPKQIHVKFFIDNHWIAPCDPSNHAHVSSLSHSKCIPLLRINHLYSSIYYWFSVGEGTLLLHHLITQNTPNKKTTSITVQALIIVSITISNHNSILLVLSWWRHFAFTSFDCPKYP